MLSRPSSRRRGKGGQIVLNLVPILDTMVTLIGFMLFTMSFLTLASIESPFPEASEEVQKETIKERPLQLTVSLRDNEAEVWSPFNKFPAKTFPNLEGGAPDIIRIHQALIEVKQQFPTETKVVFVPNIGTDYATLIAIMDSARGLEATDPTIYVKNKTTGVDAPAKDLFPNVIFGNLLGDS